MSSAPASTASSSSRQELERVLAPLAEARTLPGFVYVAPEILALEERALFGRSWIVLGREEDLPDAGSFLTRELCGERLLVVRGEDGTARAFFNVCRHRGARLVEETSGRFTGAIACPYHAWTYAFDGRLQRVPRADPGFDTGGYRLATLPMGRFGGFLFANPDAAAPALDEHFAELPDLSPYALAGLARHRRLAYEIEANWKIVCQNFSECYHCPLVHPRLNRISDITTGTFQEGAGFNGGPMRLREGFTTLSISGASREGPMAGVTGEATRLVHYYLVYPNLMLGLAPDYGLALSVWPLGPGRSRIECEFLFPPERMLTAGFDASDIVEFWDRTNREDWALCERVQRGVASRGYQPGPYHSSERCVHAFDRWYARSMRAELGAADSA